MMCSPGDPPPPVVQIDGAVRRRIQPLLVAEFHRALADGAARLVATVEVAFVGLFAFPLHIGA